MRRILLGPVPHDIELTMEIASLNSLGLAKPPHQTRVVVAMSGGVDSSVVAALLKSQGYDVIGMTLQLYNGNATPAKKGACCAGQDIDDARRVAAKIGIPHYVLDYEQKFKDSVIDSFAQSYIAGETPVPCISCNQTVKFRDLLATAKELNADVLATGHYIETQMVDGHMAMFRPIDEARDQSYFLFATTQEQLDYLRFPLGGLTKAETRALAAQHGLIVADKPDSQDICFVAGGRYAQIIEKLKPDAAARGMVQHVDGRVLGAHDGIIHFTVGQRKGLKIASDAPLYVVAIDAKNNRVVVGPREALLTQFLNLRDVNWIGGGEGPQDGQRIFARVRSARAPCAAILRVDHENVRVELCDGEEGVAPGQACVMYESLMPRARVLGGGFIAATKKMPALRLADDALVTA